MQKTVSSSNKLSSEPLVMGTGSWMSATFDVTTICGITKRLKRLKSDTEFGPIQDQWKIHLACIEPRSKRMFSSPLGLSDKHISICGNSIRLTSSSTTMLSR